MNVNIWRVRFDTVFSSSSGMERYSSIEKGLTGLVLTRGDAIEDVRSAIKTALDNQTELLQLHSAEWLGIAQDTA